jgi:2-hydroxycyclohexanecarboxyl-CoA dehydrogenase
MNLNLGAKSVIVTGGASNIGRAISLAFAAEGAAVAIADLDQAQALKVVEEAKSAGASEALAIRCDVTNNSEVQAMVATVEEKLGRVDVLVNNVGWTFDRLFIEKTREEWEKEIQINLWGVINCTRAVLEDMLRRHSGVVISIGSDAGRMGEFREAVYGACKAGVIALSKTLAREHGKHGLRFNVVCPGTTMPSSDEQISSLSMWNSSHVKEWNTPEMRERIGKAYPLRRVGTPQDVAPAVVFLASDAASFITGQTLSASGGYTMM